MNIYLLSRIDDNCSYDEFHNHIVRAETEKRAREIANTETGDEGNLWTDIEKVSCEVVTEHGDEGIILSDFHAG